MHPFFSNQISQIRSVCIISCPFHMRGSPAVPNIGSTIVVSWDFVKLSLSLSLSLSHGPFSPPLPHALLLIQTQLLLSPTKIAHAKYVKKLPFLVPLFTLHSAHCDFCLWVFVRFLFPVFSLILTQCCSQGEGWIHNWPISQRTNFKEKTQSSKMFRSKKAAQDWHECSLRKVRPWIQKMEITWIQ